MQSQTHFCSTSELRVVSPNITLCPVWDETIGTSSAPSKLICTLSGFFPAELKLEWQLDEKTQSQNNETKKSKLQSGEGAEKTFTLSSEFRPSMEVWQQGSAFTCNATHNGTYFNRTISICHIHRSSSPSIRVEIPNFQTENVSRSEAQAACLVHTVFKAKITWLIDGKPTSGNVVTENNMTHVSSKLMISSKQWKGLKSLTCRAEHKCFPSRVVQKTINAPVKAPLVEIRRSLPDLLKGNSAVFECDVKELSSRDLYVTLQHNGARLSLKEYHGLPEGLLSINSQFIVSRTEWKNDKKFSCKANQGFSTSSESNSTGYIFVDPSVEVYLDPSHGTKKHTLLCSGWGFDPHITWASKSQLKSLPTSEISMGVDGQARVNSRLLIDHSEWKTGKVFTCEVFDKSLDKKVSKDISLCSVTPASSQIVWVSVQGPPLQQLESKGPVTITCLLVGPQLNDFSITWKVNGNTIPDNQIRTENRVRHSNGTETRQSFFNVSAEDWDAYKKVSCEGRHRCSKQGNEAHISKSRASVMHSPPSAYLLQGSNELVCLVFGFSPVPINITWFHNGDTELLNYNTSEPHRGPDGKFSIQSHLDLSQVKFLPGVVLTCRVIHTNTTLSLNISKPDTLEHCNLFDDILHADANLDTAEENWKMVFTFLIFFVIATIYAIIVTLIKTKS